MDWWMMREIIERCCMGKGEGGSCEVNKVLGEGAAVNKQ